MSARSSKGISLMHTQTQNSISKLSPLRSFVQANLYIRPDYFHRPRILPELLKFFVPSQSFIHLVITL